MAADSGSVVDSIFSDIAREVESLRQAVLARDSEQIEAHSQRASRLLDQLRPLLAGRKLPVSAAVVELRQRVGDCAALIKRVHCTVRALLNVHHAVRDRVPSAGVQF